MDAALHTTERERLEREANDFVADLISNVANPVQRMVVAASAERLGCVAPGEKVIVDGRISSEVAHRMVARAIAHQERAGVVSRDKTKNRADRRANASRIRRASVREQQILKRRQS